MKIYVLGHWLANNQFREVERSVSKNRIKNAQKRYEKMYKRKFTIITFQTKI